MTDQRRTILLGIAIVSTLVVLGMATLTAGASSPAAGGWPPPVQIPQSGDSTSRGPSLALDDEGALQAIWMEQQQAPATNTLYFTVFHAESTDQGDSWSYTLPLTPSGSDRYEAAMDLDAFGGLHLAWWERSGENQVWYGQLMDGSWEDRVIVTGTTYPTVPVSSPDIEVTGDVLHMAWAEMTMGTAGSKWDVYYSRSEGGSEWSLAEIAADTKRSSLNTSMGSDSNGDLHLVWEENAKPREILYISGTVGTTETVWSMPVTLTSVLTRSAGTPDIAVGSDDQVHVVFGVDVEDQIHVQDVYYASFAVGSPGSVSPTLIAGSRVNISQLLPTYASPAVTLFGTDQVHVAWNGLKTGDYSDRIYYAVSEDVGLTWSDPVPASPRDSVPDGFPSLAADVDFVHLVWQEKASGTDQDIYYTRRFPVRITFPLGLKGY